MSNTVDVGEEGDVGCVHFPDDPNAVCTICKNPPKTSDPWETTSSGSNGGIIEAMFAGTCRCGASIIPGDLIRRVDSEWVHIDCRDNGETNICGVCDGLIHWIDAPTGGWWAHEVHPSDEHDAVPHG